MEKQLQSRMENLKALAESKMKKQKKKKKKTNRFRDELAGLSLTEALGGLDFGSNPSNDTSFYDFDCAMAARKNYSNVEAQDDDYTITTDDGIGID